MGANDNYQFGRTQPLGKVSFGDASYADQFVRAPTGDLSSTKKTTPLNVTREVVEQALELADKQLCTCSIILEKFSTRMRILQWAEEVTRPPTKELFAKQALPARPLGKLGVKGKLGSPPQPAARPKTAVSLSWQEQALAAPVAKILSQDAQARQLVQVALYQYSEATQAVEHGLASLAAARSLEPRRAFEEIGRLDVAKIQGKIYPLTNFHEAFRAHPKIARLFPLPMPRK